MAGFGAVSYAAGRFGLMTPQVITGHVTEQSALALDPDGVPHVVLQDGSAAIYESVLQGGGTWSLVQASTKGNVGYGDAIAIDSTGRVDISSCLYQSMMDTPQMPNDYTATLDVLVSSRAGTTFQDFTATGVPDPWNYTNTTEGELPALSPSTSVAFDLAGPGALSRRTSRCSAGERHGGPGGRVLHPRERARRVGIQPNQRLDGCTCSSTYVQIAIDAADNAHVVFNCYQAGAGGAMQVSVVHARAPRAPGKTTSSTPPVRAAVRRSCTAFDPQIRRRRHGRTWPTSSGRNPDPRLRQAVAARVLDDDAGRRDARGRDLDRAHPQRRAGGGLHRRPHWPRDHAGSDCSGSRGAVAPVAGTGIVSTLPATSSWSPVAAAAASTRGRP